MIKTILNNVWPLKAFINYVFKKTLGEFLSTDFDFNNLNINFNKQGAQISLNDLELNTYKLNSKFFEKSKFKLLEGLITKLSLDFNKTTKILVLEIEDLFFHLMPFDSSKDSNDDNINFNADQSLDELKEALKNTPIQKDLFELNSGLKESFLINSLLNTCLSKLEISIKNIVLKISHHEVERCLLNNQSWVIFFKSFLYKSKDNLTYNEEANTEEELNEDEIKIGDLIIEENNSLLDEGNKFYENTKLEIKSAFLKLYSNYVDSKTLFACLNDQNNFMKLYTENNTILGLGNNKSALILDISEIKDGIANANLEIDKIEVVINPVQYKVMILFFDVINSMISPDQSNVKLSNTNDITNQEKNSLDNKYFYIGKTKILFQIKIKFAYLLALKTNISLIPKLFFKYNQFGSNDDNSNTDETITKQEIINRYNYFEDDYVCLFFTDSIISKNNSSIHEAILFFNFYVETKSKNTLQLKPKNISGQSIIFSINNSKLKKQPSLSTNQNQGSQYESFYSSAIGPGEKFQNFGGQVFNSAMEMEENLNDDIYNKINNYIYTSQSVNILVLKSFNYSYEKGKRDFKFRDVFIEFNCLYLFELQMYIKDSTPTEMLCQESEYTKSAKPSIKVLKNIFKQDQLVKEIQEKNQVNQFQEITTNFSIENLELLIKNNGNMDIYLNNYFEFYIQRNLHNFKINGNNEFKGYRNFYAKPSFLGSIEENNVKISLKDSILMINNQKNLKTIDFNFGKLTVFSTLIKNTTLLNIKQENLNFLKYTTFIDNNYNKETNSDSTLTLNLDNIIADICLIDNKSNLTFFIDIIKHQINLSQIYSIAVLYLNYFDNYFKQKYLDQFGIKNLYIELIEQRKKDDLKIKINMNVALINISKFMVSDLSGLSTTNNKKHFKSQTHKTVIDLEEEVNDFKTLFINQLDNVNVSIDLENGEFRSFKASIDFFSLRLNSMFNKKNKKHEVLLCQCYYNKNNFSCSNSSKDIVSYSNMCFSEEHFDNKEVLGIEFTMQELKKDKSVTDFTIKISEIIKQVSDFDSLNFEEFLKFHKLSFPDLLISINLTLKNMCFFPLNPELDLILLNEYINSINLEKSSTKEYNLINDREINLDLKFVFSEIFIQLSYLYYQIVISIESLQITQKIDFETTFTTQKLSILLLGVFINFLSLEKNFEKQKKSNDYFLKDKSFNDNYDHVVLPTAFLIMLENFGLESCYFKKIGFVEIFYINKIVLNLITEVTNLELLAKQHTVINLDNQIKSDISVHKETSFSLSYIEANLCSDTLTELMNFIDSLRIFFSLLKIKENKNKRPIPVESKQLTKEEVDLKFDNFVILEDKNDKSKSLSTYNCVDIIKEGHSICINIEEAKINTYSGSDFDFIENYDSIIAEKISPKYTSNVKLNSKDNKLLIIDNYLNRQEKKKVVTNSKDRKNFRDNYNFLTYYFKGVNFIADFNPMQLKFLDFNLEVNNFEILDNFENTKFKKLLSKLDFIGLKLKNLVQIKCELVKNKNNFDVWLSSDLSDINLLVSQCTLDFLLNFFHYFIEKKLSDKQKEEMLSELLKQNCIRVKGENIKILVKGKEIVKNKKNLDPLSQARKDYIEEKNDKDSIIENSNSNIKSEEIIYFRRLTINKYTLNFSYFSQSFKISELTKKYLEILNLANITDLRVVFNQFFSDKRSEFSHQLSELLQFYLNDIKFNQMTSIITSFSFLQPFKKIIDSAMELVRQPYSYYLAEKSISHGITIGLKKFLVGITTQSVFLGEKSLAVVQKIVGINDDSYLDKNSYYKKFLYMLDEEKKLYDETYLKK